MATNTNTKLAKKKASTLGSCFFLNLIDIIGKGRVVIVGPKILRKVKNSWQHMVSCGTQGKEWLYVVVVFYGPMSCDYMSRVGYIYIHMLHARVGLLSLCFCETLRLFIAHKCRLISIHCI